LPTESTEQKPETEMEQGNTTQVAFIIFMALLYENVVALGDLMVTVLATGLTVRWLKSDRGRRIVNGD
jgi:hypothetical protein